MMEQIVKYVWQRNSPASEADLADEIFYSNLKELDEADSQTEVKV